MLLDQNGKFFHPKRLPNNRKAREQVLATLREVLTPPRIQRGDTSFSIGARGRLVNP